MKNTAVYPGTFDPFTYGHLDIVTRAAQLFHHVIIAITDNSAKTTLFSKQDRILLTTQATAHLSNVSALSFNELTVDFAQHQQANVLIRGLRSSNDFEYEKQIADMNKHLAPKLETIFLLPSSQYLFISSSLVKEVARYHGNIEQLVPAIVAKALHKKFV